ncbi:MAG: alpha/beta hydrolase [Chloroflexi bacterium]|nr:alpha/beta hydrolase [Chloroflexota bacterium]
MPLDIGQAFPVYFATNRRLMGSRERVRFGERCHRDGAHFYRVGTATMRKVSDDLDEGYVVTAIDVKGEGRTNPQARGSGKLFQEIRESVSQQGCDVLVYIHGFANDFEGSLVRAAQLHELYQVGPRDDPKHPVVFAFCWPSNGRVTPPWEYFSDRVDAQASGVAMARALLRLSDFLRGHGEPCNQRLHLVAHSMGNWALRHALQAFESLQARPGPTPIFDNVFLMAPDEDDDAFEHEHKLKPLLGLARRVHVYHSDDDRALVISDVTKFNPDRLGYSGLRSFSGISSRVIQVDCQDVDDTEFLHVNHQYYRRRGEVIRDVREVLIGTRPDSIAGREVVEPGRRYRILLGNTEPKLGTPDKPVGPEYIAS